MIIEHEIKGNESTVFHTFTFRTEGMTLVMSDGYFIRTGETLVSSDKETIIEIPVSDVTKHYDVLLVDDIDTPLHIGVTKEGEFLGDVDGFVELLAWFTVPPNTSSLDEINVEVKRMVRL